MPKVAGKSTKGGKRTSAYSAPKPKPKPKESYIDRWQREAAEFQSRMIDRFTK